MLGELQGDLSALTVDQSPSPIVGLKVTWWSITEELVEFVAQLPDKIKALSR